jgi:uncharacterized phage infection (PIP) family protein YhgE
MTIPLRLQKNRREETTKMRSVNELTQRLQEATNAVHGGLVRGLSPHGDLRRDIRHLVKQETEAQQAQVAGLQRANDESDAEFTARKQSLAETCAQSLVAFKASLAQAASVLGDAASLATACQSELNELAQPS